MIIPLALVGYEMIIANQSSRIALFNDSVFNKMSYASGLVLEKLDL